MGLWKNFWVIKRFKRASKRWQKDKPDLLKYASTSKVRSAGIKWGQLVWQEIHMWVSMGKQVSQEDLEFIVQRRGFDSEMKHYLIKTLKYIGIGKKLEFDK